MLTLVPRAGWLALALALLLSGCTRPASLYAPVSASQSPIADITVLEADAIVVDGQHVRLIDVAAPQPAPRAHCIAEAAIARQARLRLNALSQGVHHVTISATGHKDDYDRTEAHILFDGQDPTSTLIEEGLAVAPGPNRTDWCGPLSDAPAGAMHIALLSMGRTDPRRVDLDVALSAPGGNLRLGVSGARWGLAGLFGMFPFGINKSAFEI